MIKEESDLYRRRLKRLLYTNEIIYDNLQYVSKMYEICVQRQSLNQGDTVPLPFTMRSNKEDDFTLLKKTIESLFGLEGIFYCISDNEPRAMSVSRKIMITSNSIQTKDIDNNEEIDDDNDTLNSEFKSNKIDEYDNSCTAGMKGCITHVLSLAISYCLGIKQSTRVGPPTKIDHIPEFHQKANQIVQAVTTLNRIGHDEMWKEIYSRFGNNNIIKGELASNTRWDYIIRHLTIYQKMKKYWKQIDCMKDF